MINERKLEMVATKVSTNEQYQAAFENYSQAFEALKASGVSFELLNALDNAVGERLAVTEELAYSIGTLEK